MGRKRRSFSYQLSRLIPFGSLAGLGTWAAFADQYVLATLLAGGAAYTGRRLLDREGNRRRELRRRVKENVRELRQAAWTDKTAAPQIKRLIALQEGVLESWELLPEEYGPLLEEDLHTILDEVEATARLARRRAALRRHLESADRREVARRVAGLEKDLASLEPDSPMRAAFESALASRREELAAYDGILQSISAINAQLEGAESLLGGLRGELLSLDSGQAPGSRSSDLARLKERVAYFRRSLDEITRPVEPLPGSADTERLPIG